jgi:hypothetical protein
MYLRTNFLRENVIEPLDTVSILSPNGVYIDGSFLKGQAGAGVFSESIEIGDAYALGSNSTVFQSEVYAILSCSEQCRNLQLRDKTIYIICSAYALTI